MPNYSIIINSKFRPFSYDEMIKPVQAMYEQHSKIEEGLSELETKANIWEGLANEQTDEKAYKQYKKYADDLRAAADDLALNGLNASSRQNLYRMKSRYASEITPIEQAYERRRQLADEQRKLNVQYNGALRYDNDFSTMSLDALLDNPELSYQALNGENIAARTSSIVSNLAKSITSDPKYKSILNGQYWQSMQTAGYTPEQIIALAQNSPDAPEELRNLRSLIHNSLRDNPAYNEDWVDYWIGQGAYSGIGGTSYGTLANQDHLNPAQRQAMNIAAIEHAWRSADRQPYQKEVIGADGSLKTVWVDPVRDGATFEIRNGKRVYTSGTGIGGGTSALGMTPEKDANGNLTGRYYDPKTRKYYNADGTISANQSSRSGNGSGSNVTSGLEGPVKVTVKGGYDKKKDRTLIGEEEYRNRRVTPLKDRERLEEALSEVEAKPYDYIELPRWAREEARRVIGTDHESNYNYAIVGYKDGTAELYIEPRKIKKDTGDSQGINTSFNQDSY